MHMGQIVDTEKTAQQTLHSLPVHESQGISQFQPKP